MSNQTPLFARVFSWLPNWVGFVIIIAIGIGAIIAGILMPETCFIAFGSWAVVSAILSWITGATSRPCVTGVDPATFGGCVSNIRPWVFIVIAVLFVAMGVVCALL